MLIKYSGKYVKIYFNMKITYFTLLLFVAEREQSIEQLRAEVNHSDVICIVYSVEDEDTLDRVTSHWLPLIRSTLGQQHHTPVILVGNKVDLVDYSTMEVRINSLYNNWSVHLYVS